MDASSHHDFNHMLVEEELFAQYWLRRFVLVAPIATFPTFVYPTYCWLGDSWEFMILSLLYISTVFMMEWTYIKAAYTSPGRIREGWKVPANVIYPFPDFKTGDIPQRRHCQICNCDKPPRAHHCRLCGVCVPKYDHHCGWTANCVGENNHKYFVQFLFYTMSLTVIFMYSIFLRLYEMIISSDMFDDPVHPTPAQVSAMIIGAIFAIPTMCGVASILAVQSWAVFRNTTALELKSCEQLKHYAASIGNTSWKFVYPYDMGKYKNFIAMFGDSPAKWLLPIPSSNRSQYQDPIEWPLSPQHVHPDSPGGA